MKDILLVGKKNAVIDIKMKNRSLLNPNQKKRKIGGIKFAGTEDS